MDAERIKKEFLQENKEQVENLNWYLVKTDTVNFIVESRLLAIMIEGGRDFRNTSLVGYSRNLGWHFGVDAKIYEKIKANAYGEMYYYLGKKEYEPYITTIEAYIAGDNKNMHPYCARKLQIFFEKNAVKQLTNYDGCELKNNLKNDATYTL